MVKRCLLTLLLIFPALAFGVEDTDENSLEEVVVHGAAPEDEEDPLNWVDASHAYATDQAQALTEWMDEFFGDPNYDIETAESLVRLEWTNSLDQDEDYNTKARLRGKLQLPRVSRRLNVVFSGEEGDDLGRMDTRGSDQPGATENTAGLQYNLREKGRSRYDLTLGVNTGGVRPGARYRNRGPIGEHHTYRFTQRLQWEDDEGFYTTGQLNLDHAISENRLARWSSKAVYGEETDGVEWRSTLSQSFRLQPVREKYERVNAIFASVLGTTDPSYARNYRLGVLFRRQVYRQFLFMELEPSYNLRKENVDDSRSAAWSVVLRFELVLRKDLRRVEPGESG